MVSHEYSENCPCCRIRKLVCDIRRVFNESSDLLSGNVNRALKDAGVVDVWGAGDIFVGLDVLQAATHAAAKLIGSALERGEDQQASETGRDNA